MGLLEHNPFLSWGASVLPKINILRNCQTILWYMNEQEMVKIQIEIKLPIFEFEADIIWISIYIYMEGWVGQRGLLEMFTCIWIYHSPKRMEPDGKHLTTLSYITV